MNPKLDTLKEFHKLTPWQQGYVVYMQGDHPGSELKSMNNPHKKNTPAWYKYQQGERVAVLEAQDSEE